MTTAMVSMDLYKTLKTFNVPDGYRVWISGEDYIDDLDSLWMVLHDYDGYRILEMSVSTGTKKRLVLLLEK